MVKKQNADVVVPDSAARAKILRVAGKLFAQHGLEGVSTRDIAAKSDLNISLISYYFGGKEGLYKEVINDFAQTMTAELEPELAELNDEKIDAKTFLAKIRVILLQAIHMPRIT